LSVGLFSDGLRYVPFVLPGSTAAAQVRAWTSAAGSTYEEARTNGGKVGASETFTAVVGGGPNPIGQLTGLRSFSIAAGSSSNSLAGTASTLSMAAPVPAGDMEFQLSGPVGSVFAIEASENLRTWNLLTNVVNLTGSVKVSDPSAATSSRRFYRARLLE
jgi:hypothetical protein